MCRNIKQLRFPDRPPTDAELSEAALQFIRKVSGYRKPSRLNQPAFDRAVEEVAFAARRLFDDLVLPRPSPAETHNLESDHHAG
jgi:hypothetical protein